MDPLYQRLITIAAGALAAWLVRYVPGVNETHATDVLSAILVSLAAGWSTPHPADKKKSEALPIQGLPPKL